ncbi:MAG: hypothetical protein ACRDJP_08070 [Actinomycetota bacterium]
MRLLRTPWIRGALTLGVLGIFGAGMLISNVGAVAERREASKKFVRQLVKRKIAKSETQITNQITNTTIGEDELTRFSVTTDVTGDDTPIATIGNFTFKANCELDGDNTIIARVLIETNADNATYISDDDAEPDFDIADNATPQVWAGGDSAEAVGNPPVHSQFDRAGSAVGPTGTSVEGETSSIVNMNGFDCTLSGFLLQTNA